PERTPIKAEGSRVAPIPVLDLEHIITAAIRKARIASKSASEIPSSSQTTNESHDEGDSSSTQKKKKPDKAFLRAREISEQFDKDHETLRKRLERWRKKHPEEAGKGWIEIQDCPGRLELHAYCLATVQHIIDQCPASSERPTKKK